MSDKEEVPVAEIEEQVGQLTLNTDVGSDDGNEEISQAVVNRLVALKQIHTEVEEINEKYKEERAALEKKYEEFRAPVFEKRASVIAGDVEVELEGAESKPEGEQEGEEEKGIPGFWYQCISNHPAVGSLVTEHDLDALEFLSDISVEYTDDYSGFKLIFKFRENDFFSNTELTKSYKVSPDLLEEKAPALTSVEGSKIEWKHKKNLCQAETQKKQKAKSGRKAGQIRFVTKVEPKPSFFHFFGDPRLDDDDDEDDEPEEGQHPYQLSIDEDYEAGHAFRAEIIPDAILWFTGEALDDEDDDDFDLDDEDEEDDDEDGTDDDESDDGEGPSSTSVPTAGGSGEQPECKQS